MTRRRNLALLAVALVAGCGGGGSTSSAPQTSASPSTPASFSPPAAPTLPPGDAVPRALRARWVAADNDSLYLTLEARLYAIEPGTAPARGGVSVRGRTMFFVSSLCPLGVGRYRWTLQHRRLRLHPESPDPCVNRSGAIADRTYRFFRAF